MNQKIWIQHLQFDCQMLRPLGELLGFKYLNEIGAENNHFNSTTLNDKESQNIYEPNSSNRLQVFIVQTFQTCKKTYNFKHMQENNYTSNFMYKRYGRKM